MARIWIMSDLHVDYSRRTMGDLRLPSDVAADVCVVAGDVAGRLSKSGRIWLERSFQGMPLVLVSGNHDFWGASVDTEIGKFKDRLQSPSVHLLDGEAVELSGVRFVGGTLWTDYAIDGDRAAAMRRAAGPEGMNDFRRIRAAGGSKRLRPEHLLEDHLRQRRAIDELLSTPFAGPSVVVTHHAPLAASLLHGRISDPLDAAYATDLTDLIRRRSPKLWIHGHVHRRRDYVVHETRIVCNPRGYVSADLRRRPVSLIEEHHGFDPRFVVEV